jgi:hypothetical protein
MRASPTSRYLAISLFVGIALIGCASSTEDGELPAGAESEEDSVGSKKAPPPDFDADFQEAGAPSNRNGDPAPPNADQCIDNDDPGGAENLAKVLPATDDCDDSYKTVSGVAKGQVDVDFYKLSAEDRTLCRTDTDFEGLTAGTELCVYARCKNGTVNAVSGCKAGTPSTNDIGLKGCCAAAPAHATPDLDCSGLTDDDSADFLIRVKQINADKCLPYKFAYRY